MAKYVYNVVFEQPLGKTGRLSIDGVSIQDSQTMLFWKLPDGTIKGIPISRIYELEVKEV